MAGPGWVDECARTSGGERGSAWTEGRVTSERRTANDEGGRRGRFRVKKRAPNTFGSSTARRRKQRRCARLSRDILAGGMDALDYLDATSPSRASPGAYWQRLRLRIHPAMLTPPARSATTTISRLAFALYTLPAIALASIGGACQYCGPPRPPKDARGSPPASRTRTSRSPPAPAHASPAHRFHLGEAVAFHPLGKSSNERTGRAKRRGGGASRELSALEGCVSI